MTLLPEPAPGVYRCANPSCSNEFIRSAKRGRPRLFCKPECRAEAASFQQAKNRGTGPRFLQIAAKNKSRTKLTRVPFRVSRLMEFCTERELVNQTGHDTIDWPLVAFKELMDNALDECEEAEVAPVISVAVTPSSMIIQDNGRGIETGTIRSILDYSIRVSSREAYVSPTRGQQGNALKTILAMGYVLDRERPDESDDAVGRTVIEARGVDHRIEFKVDHINSEPKIVHTTAASPVTTGTRIAIEWPAIPFWGGSPDSDTLLENARDRIFMMAKSYIWLNPHLTLRVTWKGKTVVGGKASNPAWQKWGPRDPTSAHWYDESRLQRYLAAHVARAREMDRHRTVREFITEFRGLSGTAVQRQVLEEVGCARQSLAEFFGVEKVNRRGIAKLLASMKKHTKPVAPKYLGIIGEEHLKTCFLAEGGNVDTFNYQQRKGMTSEGIPYIVEVAFGLHQSGLRHGELVTAPRRMITGANWSVAINNPFRAFGSTGEGLEATLNRVRANSGQPVICVAHLASAYIQYSDRGKSTIILNDAEQPDD
jgi:hypothetical protein